MKLFSLFRSSPAAEETPRAGDAPLRVPETPETREGETSRDGAVGRESPRAEGGSHFRRILLPVLCAVFAYCAYAYTLPALPEEDAQAAADGSARATLRIELPAVNLYFACFGEYGDAGTARAEAARYAPRGSAAYVREEEGSYLVLASAYDSEGDARSVCTHILENEGVSASVRAYAAEMVGVRVTASGRQLEALSAVVAALEAYPRELNAMAYRIDGGTLDTKTAQSLIRVAVTEMEALERELRISLADTDDRFAMGVYTLMDGMLDSARALSEDEDQKGLALSSALKYNCIASRLGVIDFMHSLQ